MARNKFKPFIVESIPREVRWFERQLKHNDIAPNTITSYSYALNEYLEFSKGLVSPDRLLDWKGDIMLTLASSTVNVRINALNKYFRLKDVNYHMRTIKVQRKMYAENVISFEDYLYLKKKLKRDKDWKNYYLVWALGSTGCRVSEINRLKVEHIKAGRMVIYGKRRERVVYIPQKFQRECLEYLSSIHKEEGFIFEENGDPMNTHKIENEVKKLAYKYKIAPEVMHPHSFRHMYAKACVKNGMDVFDLSDLLGHASIETTRLYLRKSLNEQSEVVNRIVNW